MLHKDWFTTMDAMQREMERLVDDFSKRKPPPGQFSPQSWVPAIDIYESEEKLTVLIELCGVRAGDIELTVDGHNLILRGKRRHQSFEGTGSCQQLEIYWGPFERFIPLPSTVDPEAVRASVKNGMLELVMPKAHRDSVHQIRVTRAKRP
ncbi:MAG: heat shock protein Hsp20 [Dehalococcoidia bacterium]|nr:heat shock protein Hsp20 [Dehalococcoidia bacterium]